MQYVLQVDARSVEEACLNKTTSQKGLIQNYVKQEDFWSVLVRVARERHVVGQQSAWGNNGASDCRRKCFTEVNAHESREIIEMGSC